jgi:hypothetical protein
VSHRRSAGYSSQLPIATKAIAPPIPATQFNSATPAAVPRDSETNAGGDVRSAGSVGLYAGIAAVILALAIVAIVLAILLGRRGHCGGAGDMYDSDTCEELPADSMLGFGSPDAFVDMGSYRNPDGEEANTAQLSDLYAPFDE